MIKVGLDEIVPCLEHASGSFSDELIATISAATLAAEIGMIDEDTYNRVSYLIARGATLEAMMRLLPNNWWVRQMGEIRTAVLYAKEQHLPTGKFLVGLQHIDGGKYTTAEAATLAMAFAAACFKVWNRGSVVE